MMQLRIKLLSIGLSLTILGACNSSHDTPEPEEPIGDVETVFEPLQESVDRAKEAEALVEERKRDLDKQLEELESGKSD